MKKLLFLVMLMFASFQANAQDYSDVNYIEKYGDLKLVGNQLSAADGSAVQLRGWSTFGLQWTVSCYNKAAFAQMKAWGASIVRLAMYVYESGAQSDMDGYITKVKGFIDATNEVGIYCLVDWHVLTPGQPSSYLNSALNGKGAEYFFDAISAYVKQKGYVHVLYEICNEPNNCSWSDIKSYANTVLPHISTNDPGAIVVVGTPQWDQLIDQAVASPISYSSADLMYSFHYYACSHTQFLPKLESATKSIPCFVSEWGPVNFDGDMSKDNSGEYIICDSQSDQLMAVCDGNNSGNVKISWCAWNWGDKDEGSSALKSGGCGSIGNAGLDSKLSTAGKYVQGKLCGDGTCKTIITTGGCYGGECQTIPNDLFQIAYYDLGGEGVAFHDGDGTNFERYAKGITEDEDGNAIDASVCKTDNNGNVCYCNTGYIYAGKDWSFRSDDDCVDVSTCYGVAGDYGSYNLGGRENDEWLIYTVDVQEPGYYTFQYQATKSTGGTVEFSIQKDGTSYGNAVYNYETGEEFTGTLTFDSYTDCDKDAWMCWAWTDILPSKGKNPSILFKEAGQLQLKMFFPTEGGDLGPFKFTKAASYSGEGYPEDGANTEEINAKEGFNIYPNPTTGSFNIALDGTDKAEVIINNAMGQIVYTASINGNTEINANLASGTYIVTVKSANAVSQKKLIVK